MSLYNLLKVPKWRYERKFFIPCTSKHSVQTAIRLHPAIFNNIFYERQVNNLYFDTFALDYYKDNVIGTKYRVKVRIRWYGTMFGRIDKPTLEIKFKHALLGGKESIPVPPFEINERINSNSYNSLFESLPNEYEAIKPYLLSLKCSLLNSYNRSYFLSTDRKFRITLDSNLCYYGLPPIGNRIMHKFPDKSNLVLELKYDRMDDNLADQITSMFPFIITKSSKYVKGIDYLYT